MKIIAFIAALLFAGCALAVEPSEMLKDPALEARARAVSKELRCVQCQNESIDESNADIAHDMRLLVRERILAGDTNDQIIAYMASRYGDYVRLEPRLIPRTYLLWFGPLIVLLLGGWMVFLRLRQDYAPPEALNEDERATLATLDEQPDPRDPRIYPHLRADDDGSSAPLAEQPDPRDPKIYPHLRSEGDHS